MDVGNIARTILSAGVEGKALQPSPNSQPAPVLFGPTTITRRFAQREAGRHLQAYGGSEAVDWVMDASQLYMTTAASAPWHLEREGKRMRTPDTPGDDDKYPGGEAPRGLWNLLQHPNPYMEWDDLIELLVLDLLLVGNAYWYKYRAGEDGRPMAIYRLAPPLMEAVSGKRLIEHWEYRVPGEPQPLELEVPEVVHFKLPNPHDPIYGLGIISGSTRVYDIELAQVETQAQYFEQGAKLSGVLQTDRSVPDPIHKRIQRQFSSMYSGQRNAYKVAVLERGMTFSPISNTAAEAQFVELTKLGRERVFQMFRVHPALVNGDAAKPGLLDETQRYFDSKVMKPFLTKLGRRVSTHVTQAWDVDLKFDYEYHLPEKDRLENAQNFGGMPGVKVKEVREYLGLEPLGTEDDEIILNLPGISTEEGGIADNLYSPEGGRPASPNNTASIPRGGAPLPKGAAARRPSAKPDPAARKRLQKAMESPEAMEAYLSELAALSGQTNGDSATKADATDSGVAGLLEDKFAEGKAYRTDQVASVNSLAAGLRPKLQAATIELERELEAVISEGASMTKAQRGYLVDAVEAAPGFKALEERLADLLGPTYESAFHSAQAHYTRFGLDPIQLNKAELTRALLERADGPASVSRTLRERITRQVAEGVRRGYTVPQILEGTSENYEGVKAQFRKWHNGQAETIAITEAHAAYNLSAIEGIKAVGAKARVYDGDHDAACRAADGQLWTAEKAQAHLLEHPRCRRTFLPEVGDGN